MKSKNKQEELDKQRAIILQTLEYLIEHYTGFFVLDNYDPSKEYYLQEKKQVEKYYKERRLDRITAKLANFTQYLYLKRDIMYQHYIEEKTGHRIDLYEDLRARTNKIIQNGIISSIEEFADIEFMIGRDESNSSFDKNLLQNILDKYQEANAGQVKVPRLYTQKEILVDALDNSEISDINNTKLKDQFYGELKTEQGLIYKINSPNGKNWIALHTSGKNEFTLTYLVVGVDGGSGSAYSAKGENLKIKAYWEDDSTILIETLEKYEVINRYQKITTKTSDINIKYINKL
jgi:hypothetical protein